MTVNFKTFISFFKKLIFFVLKILGYLILIFILLFLIVSLLINSLDIQTSDLELCLDSGICAEGVELKDGVVSKEYCINHHYMWDENRKSCNVRKKTN